jgi:hypothetical protein
LLGLFGAVLAWWHRQFDGCTDVLVSLGKAVKNQYSTLAHLVV